ASFLLGSGATPAWEMTHDPEMAAPRTPAPARRPDRPGRLRRGAPVPADRADLSAPRVGRRDQDLRPGRAARAVRPGRADHLGLPAGGGYAPPAPGDRAPPPPQSPRAAGASPRRTGSC